MRAKDRDEEQIEAVCSDKFWRLIAQRRRQKTLPRAELEAKFRQES